MFDGDFYSIDYNLKEKQQEMTAWTVQFSMESILVSISFSLIWFS